MNLVCFTHLIRKHEGIHFSTMTSCFQVHNIKISLKLKSPSLSYFNEKIIKNEKIKQKKFGNFHMIYSNFTYIFFNTSSDILHCNVTKISNYRQIFSSKKELKSIFPELIILSTKIDNICGTKAIGGKICLNKLFKKLVKSNSSQFKVHYDSQKFPGLFIKFLSYPLTGTLLVFKSGKINSVGIKQPKHFIELDRWIELKIEYV